MRSRRPSGIASDALAFNEAMYLSFYGLKREPFHITPDPEFLYLSPSHKEALAAIVYGIEQRKGFVAIIGAVGVGKTTILRSYLENADKEQLRIIYVFNAHLTFGGLLRTIYQELGLQIETDDATEMLNNLYGVLIDEYKKGNTVVLVIDEAQNVPVDTLESLRMLSNLETSKDKLLQIVLVGQPEFEEALNLSRLRQLKQRLVIQSVILPLTRSESLEYIQHRLHHAGAHNAAIFTKGALDQIVRKADGIPRVINILCDNALITGFGYQQKPVTTKIVKEIIFDRTVKGRPSLRKRTIIFGLLGLGVALGLLLFLLFQGGFDISRGDRSAVFRDSTMKAEGPGKDEVSNRTLEEAKERETVTANKPVSTLAKPVPVVRVVKDGDNLFRLMEEVYGSVDAQLIGMVRQANPWIRDVNIILSGSTITFPAIPEDPHAGKTRPFGD